MRTDWCLSFTSGEVQGAKFQENSRQLSHNTEPYKTCYWIEVIITVLYNT